MFFKHGYIHNVENTEILQELQYVCISTLREHISLENKNQESVIGPNTTCNISLVL